jgi:hypothetical protein
MEGIIGYIDVRGFPAVGSIQRRFSFSLPKSIDSIVRLVKCVILNMELTFDQIVTSWSWPKSRLIQTNRINLYNSCISQSKPYHCPSLKSDHTSDDGNTEKGLGKINAEGQRVRANWLRLKTADEVAKKEEGLFRRVWVGGEGDENTKRIIEMVVAEHWT